MQGNKRAFIYDDEKMYKRTGHPFTYEDVVTIRAWLAANPHFNFKIKPSLGDAWHTMAVGLKKSPICIRRYIEVQCTCSMQMEEEQRATCPIHGDEGPTRPSHGGDAGERPTTGGKSVANMKDIKDNSNMPQKTCPYSPEELSAIEVWFSERPDYVDNHTRDKPTAELEKFARSLGRGARRVYEKHMESKKPKLSSQDVMVEEVLLSSEEQTHKTKHIMEAQSCAKSVAPLFKVGDKVGARYKKRLQKYDATVLSVSEDGNKFIIEWDDGDSSDTEKQANQLTLIPTLVKRVRHAPTERRMCPAKSADENVPMMDQAEEVPHEAEDVPMMDQAEEVPHEAEDVPMMDQAEEVPHVPLPAVVRDEAGPASREKDAMDERAAAFAREATDKQFLEDGLREAEQQHDHIMQKLNQDFIVELQQLAESNARLQQQRNECNDPSSEDDSSDSGDVYDSDSSSCMSAYGKTTQQSANETGQPTWSTTLKRVVYPNNGVAARPTSPSNGGVAGRATEARQAIAAVEVDDARPSWQTNQRITQYRPGAAVGTEPARAPSALVDPASLTVDCLRGYFDAEDGREILQSYADKAQTYCRVLASLQDKGVITLFAEGTHVSLLGFSRMVVHDVKEMSTALLPCADRVGWKENKCRCTSNYQFFHNLGIRAKDKRQRDDEVWKNCGKPQQHVGYREMIFDHGALLSKNKIFIGHHMTSAEKTATRKASEDNREARGLPRRRTHGKR